ncbi:hypothetical protein C9374_001678 [Naegleria lovaniensis]|uniref:WASP family protein member n=1 Tax=Naegleria lovaniensis TaxID=51637 RepID=A0AA88GS16_NAELO|nr:uncharacterized protein C9374_001678 [Naegleria lovaniensis]KAG2387346.1 hypothetical protein C9374_001678 [Naegleria lovaniensis]
MSLIMSYGLEHSQTVGERLYGNDVFEKVKNSLSSLQPSTTENISSHLENHDSNKIHTGSKTKTAYKSQQSSESHTLTASTNSISSTESSKNKRISSSIKSLSITLDTSHQNYKGKALDHQTTNQCIYLTTLLGMLDNLRKLSIASQVAIANITSLSDKTFKRVCLVHDKYQELRAKLESMEYDHLRTKDETKPVVRYQEPEQGRFNPSTMSDGWYEQYLKCPDNPNFKPLEDLILKPGYANTTISQNYSNPDGIFSSWKDNYVRQMKNEIKNNSALASSRKSLQIGDVVVPEKKVKRIKQAWKQFDKDNGLKQLVQKREGSCSSSTQLSESQKIVITGCQQAAPTRKTKIHSVMRSASQKTILTTATNVSSPPKADVRRKPLPSIPKSNSQASGESNISELSLNLKISSPSHESSPIPSSTSEEVSQPISSTNSSISESTATASTILSQQDCSHTDSSSIGMNHESRTLIPPPPSIPAQNYIPPPPPMSSAQSVLVTSPTIPPPPPLTSISLTSNAVGIKISELAGVSRQQKQSVSPRDQTVRNDTMADLLESIRKGIKLSKATERVIAQKPPPTKEAFDVFSVLKEKFKLARGGESCDESFRHNYGESASEDW